MQKTQKQCDTGKTINIYGNSNVILYNYFFIKTQHILHRNLKIIIQNISCFIFKIFSIQVQKLIFTFDILLLHHTATVNMASWRNFKKYRNNVQMLLLTPKNCCSHIRFKTMGVKDAI